MYQEQLDFSRKNIDKDDPNYFIYNINSPKINQNYITDLQNIKLQNQKVNDINHPDLPMSEQLQFKLHLNEHIFPTEKPNALFYNSTVEKNQYNNNKQQTKVKINKRQKGKSKSKGKIIKSQKSNKVYTPKNNNTQYNINENRKNKHYDIITPSSEQKGNTFNLSSNTGGLFDPSLKKRELDYPSRTKNQMIERMKKINNYNQRFGKKVQNLEKFDNFLDVFDIENRKNSNDGEYLKYTKKNKEELLNKILGMKEAKMKYTQCNLEFNFSKYEDMIRSLQSQIEYEKKMRTDLNMKYLQKMKELEEMSLTKMLNRVQVKKKVNLSKRAKSAIRIYSPSNKRLRKIKASKEFRKFFNQSKKAIHISKKRNSEDNIREINQQLARKAVKKLDKEFKQFNTELNIKKTQIANQGFISTKHINKLSQKIQLEVTNCKKQLRLKGPNITDRQNNSNASKSQQLNYSNPNMLKNNAYSQEQQIANALFQQNAISQLDSNNKYQLLANLNKSIENYTKGFPIILNKVNEVIDKIGKKNVFDGKTHSIIKIASRATGELIHKNIDEITELLIDDMLYDVVNDLQYIEDIKNKQQDKKNFVQFLSKYYSNVKKMRKMEGEVLDKLQNKNPLAPYKSLTKTNADRRSHEIINPFDENYANENEMGKGEDNNNNSDNFDYMQKQVKYLTQNQNGIIPLKYTTSVNPKLTQSCEEYTKKFKEYMELKGSFYFPNIFGIYDEFASQYTKEILNEQIDVVINEMDDYVGKLYAEEVIKMQ